MTLDNRQRKIRGALLLTHPPGCLMKDEFKERLKNLEIQLDMLEKQTTFNELDMHISKAEISKDLKVFQPLFKFILHETPRRVGQQQSPSDLSLSVV
jgi:hypothetical protein